MSCAVCNKTDAKLRKCGGCGDVAYCSVDHQREHWKTHKNECKQKHLKKDSGNAIESHLRKGNADDQPRVSSEDQKDINLFGKSNARLQDLKDEIRAKEEEVQNLDDAVLEVEGCFEDDSCRVKIGEVYVQMSNEDALERAQSDHAHAKSELNVLKSELTTLLSDMESLKMRLKLKFGDAINLENDPEAK